ncbi:MAG: hypothetical protein ACR2NM_10850, partial [Bythopirellula sp.]
DATPASPENDTDENNAQQNDPNGRNPNGNGPNAALEKLNLPEFSQEAVYFSPTQNRDDQLGMLLWLGDGDAGHNQSRADNWQAICRRDGLVLLIAPPEEAGTWKTDDLGYLQQLARAATRRLNVDRRRLVIGGQGKAGQLAYALALKRRTSTAGIISVDAPLPRTVNVPKTSPRSQLAVLAIESRNSNFAPLIRRDIQLLRETGYPVTFLQRPATSDVTNEIDAATRFKMARWIDGLDRL